MTTTPASVEAMLRKQVSLLHYATIVLLDGMGGHNHWDNTMQHGSGCPICIQQRVARGMAEDLIERAEIASSPSPPPAGEPQAGGEPSGENPNYKPLSPDVPQLPEPLKQYCREHNLAFVGLRQAIHEAGLVPTSDVPAMRVEPQNPWAVGTPEGMLGACQRIRSCLRKARESLSSAVCTKGEDAGVVMLSQDGPTHREEIDGKTVQVYDHEFFSPLGDALIDTWHRIDMAWKLLDDYERHAKTQLTATQIRELPREEQRELFAESGRLAEAQGLYSVPPAAQPEAGEPEADAEEERFAFEKMNIEESQDRETRTRGLNPAGPRESIVSDAAGRETEWITTVTVEQDGGRTVRLPQSDIEIEFQCGDAPVCRGSYGVSGLFWADGQSYSQWVVTRWRPATPPAPAEELPELPDFVDLALKMAVFVEPRDPFSLPSLVDAIRKRLKPLFRFPHSPPEVGDQRLTVETYPKIRIE